MSSNINFTNFDELLERQLEDKEFKEEYDALEDEFTLAREVMLMRKANHLTQKDLAKLAGTSQPAIARLESGSYQNLSLSFINKVASALGAIPEIHLRKT